MRSEAREQISALMDNELRPQEQAMLWRRIQSDVRYRQVWERYQAGAQAMRGPLHAMAPKAFADRVMVALDDPENGRATTNTSSAWPVGRNRVAALAAGVAVVVFGLTYLVAEHDSAERNPSMVQTIAGTAPIARANFAPEATTSPAGLVRAVPEDRFTRYLVDHNEHAGLTRIRGVMPYARIATKVTDHDR